MVRHRGDSSEVEAQIQEYAKRLTAWPIDLIEPLLASWPNEHEFWPTWHDLASALPSPTAARALPSPGRAGAPETWNDRCKRLFPTPDLDSLRFSRIGVGRWGQVMRRHRDLTDAQLTLAIERLDQGRPAFDNPGHGQLTDVAGFRAAMAKVRNPPGPMVGREPLLKIGEDVEARNGL